MVAEVEKAKKATWLKKKNNKNKLNKSITWPRRCAGGINCLERNCNIKAIYPFFKKSMKLNFPTSLLISIYSADNFEGKNSFLYSDQMHLYMKIKSTNDKVT